MFKLNWTIKLRVVHLICEKLFTGNLKLIDIKIIEISYNKFR